MKLGDLPPDFETFICEHVFRSESDVRLVIFDEDQSLQMLCGELHENSDGARLVGVAHLLHRHTDLRELCLPPGFEAMRTHAGQWRIQPFHP